LYYLPSDPLTRSSLDLDFLSPSYTFRCTIFFFLILWRPPRSTLFPYTTLFRSKKCQLSMFMFQQLIPLCYSYVNYCLNKVILKEDRKSTRLNSSHVSISYAVFCLKKKKKK